MFMISPNWNSTRALREEVQALTSHIYPMDYSTQRLTTRRIDRCTQPAQEEIRIHCEKRIRTEQSQVNPLPGEVGRK